MSDLGTLNLGLGWISVGVGLLGGAALGGAFLRDDFLGGYATPRRRLVRLAHIAMIALGVLNILFALTADHVVLAAGPGRLASLGLAVGAITMPLACLLVAWRRAFYLSFAVPVISLVGGAMLTAWGLLS